MSSATSTEGDRINLRVDEAVKVDGVTAIRSGAMAVGTVTSAHKRGFMGKAGDLNITLDYVKVGDDRVRVRANKGKEGEGRIGSTVALTVVFGPLGLLKRGKDVEIQAGAPITALVDQDVELAVTPSSSSLLFLQQVHVSGIALTVLLRPPSPQLPGSSTPNLTSRPPNEWRTSATFTSAGKKLVANREIWTSPAARRDVFSDSSQKPPLPRNRVVVRLSWRPLAPTGFRLQKSV